MKIALTISLLLLTAGADWITDMDSAKHVAAENHKQILLNFSGSDWCGPCIKMKKEVFESEAFMSIANDKLVLVRADFPRLKKNMLSAEQTKHNEMLADKYNPEGKFPLTLLLDADGNVIEKWDGYVFASQEEFIADLRQAISARK